MVSTEERGSKVLDKPKLMPKSQLITRPEKYIKLISDNLISSKTVAPLEFNTASQSTFPPIAHKPSVKLELKPSSCFEINTLNASPNTDNKK